jgi:hypothetical protein
MNSPRISSYFRRGCGTSKGNELYYAIQDPSRREAAIAILEADTDLPKEEIDMLRDLADPHPRRRIRGLTCYEAIAIAEAVRGDPGARSSGALEMAYLEGFRHAKRELLIALTAAGAFNDGRNMTDLLIGRVST